MRAASSRPRRPSAPRRRRKNDAPRPGWRRVGLLAALAACGCGKKGAAAGAVRAHPGGRREDQPRRGSATTSTSRSTVPTTEHRHVDADRHRAHRRLRVYRPRRADAVRWPELGTVVASIPVVPPPVGADDRPLPPAPDGRGRDCRRGGHDRRSADRRRTSCRDRSRSSIRDSPRCRRCPTRAAPTVLQRFYIAIGFSQRGRPGAARRAGRAGAHAACPTRRPTCAPPTRRRRCRSTWEPSGGLRRVPARPRRFRRNRCRSTPLQPVAAAAPVIDASAPAGPTTYNVYRELAPDPFLLPPAATSGVERRRRPPRSIRRRCQ